MSILNKKGQDVSINWIVGALSGILISSILLSVGIQWYLTTQHTEDSFQELVSKIEKMQDGDKSSMAYYLPDEYLLVSFSGGEDFDTNKWDIPGRSIVSEESCAGGKVNVPESCGNVPCLCVCSGSYKYGYENACTKKAVACYAFTSENLEGPISFYDSDCRIGVYREGTDNGIFSLFLEKEDNTIKFCTIEGCVTEEQEKAVDATKLLVDAYESCAEKREDCSCVLDFSFFQENPYALHFTNDQLGIYDFSTNNEFYTLDLPLSASFSNTNDFYLHNYKYTSSLIPTDAAPSLQRISDVALTDEYSSEYMTSEELVITLKKEDLFMYGSEENENTISSTLYKKTSAMEFKTSTYDFSNVKSCTELETSSSQEVKIA